MNTKDIHERANFIDNYMVAALWSSTNVVDGKDVDLDQYKIVDIDPDTREKMRKDCEAFMDANAEDLASLDPEQAGHDFWLTRNGHGAGFWDRGLEEVGDRLAAACGWQTAFPEMNLYIGDDGKIHA